MKRKLTALILVFTMLVSLSPAVAADEMSATPTVEEILNEYHQKAFDSQRQGDNDAASTWSTRGGAAKTLEQETVDALTEAGYEAYNVTADNYEELETKLKSDFASMGLAPEGSYIVVISGEDSAASQPDKKQNSSRSSPDMNFEQSPEYGGSYFTFTYDGIAYSMRYVTVTGADSLKESGVYAVQDVNRLAYILENLFSTTLIAFADEAFKIPFGTMADLLLNEPDDYVYAELDVDGFAIHSRSEWTCEYIQILDSYNDEWFTSQMSEYVYTSAFCAGYVTDLETGKGVPNITEECSNTIYSKWYFDLEKRKIDAVEAYDYPHDRIYFDTVEYVKFSMGDMEGEVLFDSENDPLFTHSRGTTLVLPD